MKRSSILLTFWLGIVALSPTVLCVAAEPARSVYQISSLTALKRGAYDGIATMEQLSKHGDFGIGTVQALNGEMVALNGQFHLVTVDGKVHRLEDNVRVPFAVVTHFEPTRDVALQAAQAPNFDQLRKSLDRVICPGSGMFAVKIQGDFSKLKLRSVPQQEKPYPALADVLKQQQVFTFDDAAGTMVGFRFPEYMAGVNAPGYHFHFIGEDGRIGGHVLDCTLSKGVVSWVQLERFVMETGSDMPSE